MIKTTSPSRTLFPFPQTSTTKAHRLPTNLEEQRTTLQQNVFHQTTGNPNGPDAPRARDGVVFRSTSRAAHRFAESPPYALAAGGPTVAATSQPNYNNPAVIVDFIMGFKNIKEFNRIITAAASSQQSQLQFNNPDASILTQIVTIDPTSIPFILGELGSVEDGLNQDQRDSIIEVLINIDTLKKTTDFQIALGRIAGSPKATADQITKVLGVLSHSKMNQDVGTALWFIGESKNLTPRHVVTMLEIFFRLDPLVQKIRYSSIKKLAQTELNSLLRIQRPNMTSEQRDLVDIFEDALTKL